MMTVKILLKTAVKAKDFWVFTSIVNDDKDYIID
jgi:hypothetical protein